LFLQYRKSYEQNEKYLALKTYTDVTDVVDILHFFFLFVVAFLSVEQMMLIKLEKGNFTHAKNKIFIHRSFSVRAGFRICSLSRISPILTTQKRSIQFEFTSFARIGCRQIWTELMKSSHRTCSQLPARLNLPFVRLVTRRKKYAKTTVKT